MKRKNTPFHDKWHRRVEGQIRCCMNAHPYWFKFNDERERINCINSLTKRIVGEIAADLTLASDSVLCDLDLDKTD